MGSEVGPPKGGSLEGEVATRSVTPPSERERLIDALAKSCANKGYVNTTVDDLLSISMLTREAFDRNFESIEACAIAAIDSTLAEVTTAAVSSYSPTRPVPESLMIGMLALLQLSAARPMLVRFAFLDARQILTPQMQARYRGGVAVLTAMLSKLQNHVANDRAVPTTAARGAFGGGEALLTRELLAGRAERLPELLPDLIYGALSPFVEQQEALRYMELAQELVNESG